jgi:hypothetical protein
MVPEGPRLTTGMQRSAVGVGYESSTASAPGYTDLETTAVRLSVSHGWFIADNAEFGGKLFYQGAEVDDGVSTAESDAYLLAGFARFYFPGGTHLYPYVEGLLGLGNIDYGVADDDFTTFSIGVGAMNFLTASTALDAIVKYQKDSYDISEVEVDAILMELSYSVFW